VASGDAASTGTFAGCGGSSEWISVKRLEAASVELSAARRGVFVGIGSNDRPRYMQRADHLEQEVAKLAETLAERDRRFARLDEKLAAEKARYGLLAAADIVAPTKGRIWETLVSPGQQVHRSEVLLRLLDCDRPAVTALISETVYNQLQVGQTARFVPRGSREEMVGRIIRLSRVFPSDLAIQAAATGKTYHVTVAMPQLAERGGCQVGGTGSLKFDEGRSEIAATANVSTAGPTPSAKRMS
jgi:multidrug resistance efflux pump